ncbi:MAG: hypothetical protein OXC15_11420 [Rhodospirillaceae bacterium]|nr:hypothetical protein [Rhodospirillaceae bacterium]
MTETLCLVMPAAALAAPTPSRTGRRGVSGAQDDRFRARDAQDDRIRARDARDAATSLALSEMRLREVEARARERADPSNEAIVARARELMAGSGGTLNAIEAVHRARAEAGLARPRGPSDADIVAGARRLMAESGGTLNVIAAVHRVRAEAATLASRGANARESQAWERRQAQHERVAETMEDTAFALERRLMARARALIAAARRAMATIPCRPASSPFAPGRRWRRSARSTTRSRTMDRPGASCRARGRAGRRAESNEWPAGARKPRRGQWAREIAGRPTAVSDKERARFRVKGKRSR